MRVELLLQRWFYISVFVPLFIFYPLLAGISRYRRLQRPAIILLGYVLTGGITNFIASFLAKQHTNNLPLLHVYTAAELLLLGWFYQKVIPKGIVTRLLPIVMVLFIGFCAFNAFFLQSIYAYNTNARVVGCVLLIFLAVYCFVKNLGYAALQNALLDPVFWANTGLLLYFSGSLFLFAFAAYTAGNRQLDILAWKLHATFVLIMYLLVGTGFLLHKKHEQ